MSHSDEIGFSVQAWSEQATFAVMHPNGRSTGPVVPAMLVDGSSSACMTPTVAGSRLRRIGRPKERLRATDVTRDNLDQVLSDLDKSVAGLKLAEIQNHRLEREVEMLRREFARLHSAKRATDLDMLETRRAIKELEQRLAQVRQTISWQLGSALVDSAQSLRAAMQLPARLHKVFKSSRQLRRRWADARGRVPQNLVESAESVHLASSAVAMVATHDSEQAAAWARRQNAKPAVLANALIEIAKAMARSDPLAARALGSEAVELYPIEGRVKHLAFQLGDFGHIRAAVALVDKAATAGAKFNISEAKKAEGLRALLRLTQSPPAIVKHSVSPNRPTERRIALVGRETAPFHSTSAAFRLHDRAVMAESSGWRATIIPPPGTGRARKADLRPVAGRHVLASSINVMALKPTEHAEDVVDLYLSSAAASIAAAAVREGASIIRADAFFTTGVAAAMAARSIGCPLVVDVDELLDPHEAYYEGYERTEKGKLQIWVTLTTARAADACIVSNARMMKLLRDVGIAQDRIVIAPHMYPMSVLDEDDVQVFAQSLGLGNGPVIGVVRDLCSSYDSGALADVLARLAPEFPNIKLLVVGAGRGADGLRRSVAEHNLGHALVLVEDPRPEDTARYRALLDVSLFTRHATTKSALMHPYEVSAAMAQSRACVAFRTIDASELIQDGVSGVLCSAGDAADMAGAVSALLRDPDRRRGLGARAGSAYAGAIENFAGPPQIAGLYAGLAATRG